MSKLSDEILIRITERIVKYKLTANDIFDVAAQLQKLATHKAIGEHLDEFKSGEKTDVAADAEAQEQS